MRCRDKNAKKTAKETGVVAFFFWFLNRWKSLEHVGTFAF